MVRNMKCTFPECRYELLFQMIVYCSHIHRSRAGHERERQRERDCVCGVASLSSSGKLARFRTKIYEFLSLVDVYRQTQHVKYYVMYRVIQEESAILWEMIVCVILSKNRVQNRTHVHLNFFGLKSHILSFPKVLQIPPKSSCTVFYGL
jgi:hypothetical protein